jgi:hypothetical protein
VGAKASDFQLGLSSNKTGLLNESEVISYEINYGSYLLGLVKPLVITGSWSRGTVAGSPSPSVDIVDYVIGSGSTGWGGVAPVIDLVNRKITWTIYSFPANTINQTVGFQLRVNNSYSGSSNVGFDVSAILDGANVVTIDSVVNQTYKPAVLPTSTPTPGPTNTPGAVATVTSTTTNTIVTSTPTTTIVPKLLIKGIEILELTSQGVKIGIENNQNSRSLTIKYGTDIKNLNKKLVLLSQKSSVLVKIDDLQSATNYFFVVEVVAESGEITESDLYSFKTALDSELPEIDMKSSVLLVANNVMTDLDRGIVLTPGQDYAIRFTVSKPKAIKSIKMVIKNTQILGISSVYGAEPNSLAVDLGEIEEGVFSGHLISPKMPGYYDILLRTEDINGNIFERVIGKLRIVEPLTIVDSNQRPIENAKLVFYKYNSKKQIFELISKEVLGFENPVFSEPDGRIILSLPNGRYRVEVSEIGYQNKTVEFEIGFEGSENFPNIMLTEKKASLVEIAGYYKLIIIDSSVYFGKSMKGLIVSVRFYRLNIIFVLLSFVVAGVNYLAKSKKIEWWKVPGYYLRQLRRLEKGKISGRVIDKMTRMPISGAKVLLMDSKRNRVLTTSQTDTLGGFEMDVIKAEEYKVAAVKDGYVATDLLGYSLEGLKIGNIIVEMENEISNLEKIEGLFDKWLNNSWQFLLGVWLFLLLVFEVMYLISFGVKNVWWTALLSLVTFTIWLKK